MFQRRVPKKRSQKVRELFFPAMGLRRLARYYQHRMGRLPGTPNYIASGFAAGIAISFTPFIGFHIMLGIVAAWLLRSSIVAMVLGSVLAGNPWTFPIIWVATYKLGKWFLGHNAHSQATHALQGGFTFADLLDKPMELLLPMTLGSIPFFVASWFISFYIVQQVVKKYKHARLARIYKAGHKK